MTQPRISLAMIVRNEASRLAGCLECVRQAVDEIVIVDTGSSDATLQIARTYTPKVYSYRWQDDFAAARNYAIEQTTGDWVLSLDADEQLSVAPGDLQALISRPGYTAFCLPLHALKAGNEGYEYDRYIVLRLFRQHYRFTGPVHEYVLIDTPQTIGHAWSPVIWHQAVPASERNSRRGRNIRLLKTALARTSPAPCLHYYLGAEWLGLNRIELAIPALQTALRQLSATQVMFRSPAVRHLISCYRQSAKLAAATRLCLEESERYPEYGDLFFDGAVLFELQGEYTLAMKWLQEAIRLGPPPLAFFHTEGTDTYLAYYHLGYCAEKLGLVKEAQTYYEQAVNASQNYYYPLYPLIMLKLIRQPAGEVLAFLREQGYLTVGSVAEEMAELFRTAGLPDIGLQCLTPDQTGNTPVSEILITCRLYSGDITGALQSIQQMRRLGLALSTTAAVDEIIALMLVHRFEAARQQLWHLRQTPDNQHVFRAVFCLYKQLCHNTTLPLANPRAASSLLEISNRCLQVRTKKISGQPGFAAILTAIKDILAAEADSFALFIRNLTLKEQGVKQSLAYTFSHLRGLYP
ncbi:tetratricopeptide repeat-containing glycosyltransferase family 2 protein [Sporomusa termitida]|uniref:Peptide S-glycosyltransferase, SunS family n=1 Tax=Sporomusa termitida TaxID=2377 RepID=A0A517DYX9_9FIRM|nr:glycosyltransferase [Sporomusa termitida]QDR82549.1 peptide S-glycosyltransferase, SunS family [Sporomusa termitida]